MNPRANPLYPGNSDMIAAFQAAGIPIHYRTASGILHWKTMLFAGQNVVEFDGANYSPTAFIYKLPSAITKTNRSISATTLRLSTASRPSTTICGWIRRTTPTTRTSPDR